MDLQSFIKRINTLHMNIAQDVYPNGVILICTICDKRIDATTEMCAEYLAHGWPVCHSRTMKQYEEANE